LLVIFFLVLLLLIFFFRILFSLVTVITLFNLTLLKFYLKFVRWILLASSYDPGNIKVIQKCNCKALLA
jgi:hypothetical protein